MRPQCHGHDLNLTRKIEVVVINNDEIVDVTMMFRYVTVDYIFTFLQVNHRKIDIFAHSLFFDCFEIKITSKVLKQPAIASKEWLFQTLYTHIM